MPRFVYYFIVLLSFTSCTENKGGKQPEEKLQSISIDPIYRYEIIQSNFGGYGYQIIKEGKLYINQPNIPAIQGNSGFSSKKDAEKVAAYLIQKLEQQSDLPTITKGELDSLLQ